MPTNIQELRSFLGLLNYYGKFIPNLATLIHPLNELLQLPLPSIDCPSGREVSVFNVGQAAALPVTFHDIQTATRQDKTLGKVFTYVQNDWPQQAPDSIKSYKTRQNEIGTESGCLMWGIRVIVPEKLQARVLKVPS